VQAWYGDQIELDDVLATSHLHAARWWNNCVADLGEEVEMFKAYQKVHKTMLDEWVGEGNKPGPFDDTYVQAHTDFVMVRGVAKVLKEGTNHFRATSPLVEKMLLTTTGIGWEDLRLPFEAFVIDIPGKIFRVAQSSGSVSITTILVFSPSKVSGGKLGMVFYGQSDDATAVFSHQLHEAPTLYESINRCVSESPIDDQHFRTQSSSGVIGDDAHIAMMETAINLILYISSSPHKEKYQPPGLGKARKRAHRLKGRAKQEAIRRLEELRDHGSPYVVGTKVTIDKKLKHAAGEIAAGRKITMASYVRGHLRNQAHGPSLSLRKIIWIEPHWRGLEAEKVSQKNYNVL
jgi:hypothetical protein